MYLTVKILAIIYLFGESGALNIDHFEGIHKTLNDSIESTENKDSILDKLHKKSGNYSTDANNETIDYRKVIKQLPTTISLKHVKESMDKDTACCMLGQIAGDKGYHCHAMFYGFNILERNTNRAHNQKLPFYGRDKMPHFGEKLMLKFEKCLTKKGHIFNKCCHWAANDRHNSLNPQYNTLQHYLYNRRQRGGSL